MTWSEKVRLLKVYVGVASVITLAGTGIATSLAAQNERQRFAEIDVERINVVEANGQLRLVISNSERAPDPVIHGKQMKRVGGNAPGLIFFNEDGQERGGLMYSNNNASLTFDKYQQPELLRFAYSEGPQGSEGGLSVIDRPNRAPSEAEMARMIAQETAGRFLDGTPGGDGETHEGS